MKRVRFHTTALLTCLIAHVHAETPQSPSFAQKFLIGASTGLFTTLAVEPLVYAKNTWQQGKSLSPNPRVFYRGLFVNGVGFVPTMALQNSVFGQTVESLQSSSLPHFQKNLIASIAAGCTSTVPCSPRELLIIQQQNNGGKFYQVAHNIIHKHGALKLFRGSTPIMIRNSSFAGFFFVATPLFQNKIKADTDNTTLQKIVPSLLAGSLSALATHPLDTIKTFMQAHINNKNSLSIAKDIYNHNGGSFKNFYRGLTP